MEDVLSVYTRPYDPKRPQICLDERPVQLLADSRPALPARPGTPRREDYEYERRGMANLFLWYEPLKESPTCGGGDDGAGGEEGGAGRHGESPFLGCVGTTYATLVLLAGGALRLSEGDAQRSC